jgi:hypothetical protein
MPPPPVCGLPGCMNTLHLLSNAHMRWVTHDTNGRFTMADSCRQGTAGGGGGAQKHSKAQAIRVWLGVQGLSQSSAVRF